MTDRFSDGQRVTRAKVYVSNVEQMQWGTAAAPRVVEKVTMKFVSGNDPDSENAKFWEATPSAEPITMTIVNPVAQGMLTIGDEFYLDFIKAVRTPES